MSMGEQAATDPTDEVAALLADHQRRIAALERQLAAALRRIKVLEDA